MGVHCEINLFKPTDGAFLPGSTVSGVIKYAVDEETVFNKIDVSLKGNGRLIIRDDSRRRRRSVYTYRNSEEYVDIENIVHNDDKAPPLPAGSYEFPFSFTLPHSIPASLHYYRKTVKYRIRCIINYYISIKFHRPGLFKFAKKFKKEITVVPAIKARLPMEPTIYGEQKKLFQLFSRKPNIVNIKANIECCVIKRGGHVNMNYEIFNHTDLNIKGVETKLVEIYTFTTKGHRKVKMYRDIENTDTKTGTISSGVSQNMDVTINVPSDLGSLEYSNLVSRDYFVYITAIIPFPHFNAVLEVPLQIGDTNDPSFETVDDPPPSYWEVMAEDEKKGDGLKEDGDNEDSENDEIS
ncbi:unnamed protein product [Diatraea saccharalis]|uniref:Arrestin C-terminal-like domain-containing protein n=1 Tax=Diatraea saccharalis TaxID=40085 RepID=A0A9N9WC06_9NEOP|nr:unnamed protein product [Diatraea saccharalis]